MNEKEIAALREEMPFIIEQINRVIAANPDLRESGLRFSSLGLEVDDSALIVPLSHESFLASVKQSCPNMTICVSADGKRRVTTCNGDPCPTGFFPA